MSTDSMSEGQVGSILQVLTDHSCLQSSGSHLCVPEALGVDGNEVTVAQTFLDSLPEDVSQEGDLLAYHVAPFLRAYYWLSGLSFLKKCTSHSQHICHMCSKC